MTPPDPKPIDIEGIRARQLGRHAHGPETHKEPVVSSLSMLIAIKDIDALLADREAADNRAERIAAVVEAARDEDIRWQRECRQLTCGMDAKTARKYTDTPLHLALAVLDAVEEKSNG